MSGRVWGAWWRAALARAVRALGFTFASTAGAKGVLMDAVEWRVIALASVTAAVMSLATSLAGLPELANVDDGQAATGAEAEAPTVECTPAGVVVRSPDAPPR